MKKKSTLSNVPTNVTSSVENQQSIIASTLSQQGYTKKQGCGCGKK
ncbi:hypothetical protein P4313_19515 [Bacillus tropicus]|nr:hypothetical protein [Bacillus tropicus]